MPAASTRPLRLPALRRLLALVTTLGLALGGLTLVAGSASAHDGWSRDDDHGWSSDRDDRDRRERRHAWMVRAVAACTSGTDTTGGSTGGPSGGSSGGDTTSAVGGGTVDPLDGSTGVVVLRTKAQRTAARVARRTVVTTRRAARAQVRKARKTRTAMRSLRRARHLAARDFSAGSPDLQRLCAWLEDHADGTGGDHRCLRHHWREEREDADEHDGWSRDGWSHGDDSDDSDDTGDGQGGETVDPD